MAKCGGELTLDVVQYANEYEEELDAELYNLRTRLAEALEEARQAFAQTCLPGRTFRAADSAQYHECVAETVALKEQLHAVLARRGGHSGDVLAPGDADRILSAGGFSPRVQAALAKFEALVDAEIAIFDAGMAERKAELAQMLFGLCDADGARRGLALEKIAACHKQVDMLQQHVDSVLKTALKPPRPRFVHVEQRYALRLHGNEYAIRLHSYKVLPFLSLMIQADPLLAKCACVPAGEGPQDYRGGQGEAFLRGEARGYGPGQAGLIEVISDANGVPAHLTWTRFVTSAPVQAGGPKKPTVTYLNYTNEVFAGIKACGQAGRRFVLLKYGAVVPGVAHANGLLVDFAEHTVERIDPHGGDDEGRSPLFQVVMDHYAKIITQSVSRLGFGAFTYAPPLHVCPHVGPQTAERRATHGGGYCVAWSAFILLARALNPDYSTFEVQEHIVDGRSGKYLQDLIRAFVAYVERVITKGAVPRRWKDEPRFASAGPEAPFKASIEDDTQS